METAQNSPSSGDQQTDSQLLSAALVRMVQLTPSGEVMTRLPVPLMETAQNSPSSGDQQTDSQPLSAALVRMVQPSASGRMPARARNTSRR